MNKEWSLSKLYQSYEDPQFLADYNKVDAMIQDFIQFVQDLDHKEQRSNLVGAIGLLESQFRVMEKLFTYASFRQAVNTSDVESASYLGRLNQKVSDMTKPMTKFKQYVASIDGLDKLIESDTLLSEYRFMLLQMKDDAKYMLSEDVEAVIAKFNISGGQGWEDLQSYLTSTVKVDYKGEQTTLTSIRNLAYDPDSQVRQEAYEAELACYDKIKDSIAFALNNIKLQVMSECELRGFSTPLEQTLHDANMKRETLDAMFGAIEEYLPKFHEYLRIKAKALGHSNGLPWYDLFAPMGNNMKKYTTEEAKDYLVSLFEQFSPDLAGMVTRAFDESWIDFEPREGKVGGAFCSGIHTIQESRILTNFEGSFSDVVTLAHELGHAYHNLNIESHRPLNTEYSMPVAETASTFNENIIMNKAIEEADTKDRKLALIESQLQDVTQIICDIYSRYLFETEVFEKRKDNFLFADQLCEIMIDAQKKAYGDGLDNTVLHPYMWVCKGHYYSSGQSFYNFPYAFGGLFARGLYAKYLLEGKDFIPKYKELLHATPVMTVEDAAMLCNIDLTDRQFWRLGLESYTNQIELLKELID